MESITIKFTANGQTLTGGGLYCASNTVHYIIADFELGDGWDGFDSVRAVWSNDFKCISTVLDPDGSCTVPHEVLERRGKVSVNLVGSILEDDELTDRLTTYPVLAITVDANAKICGTETAEVTPSQFEQYVAIVIAEVEKVTGMTAVAQALPEGSEPTANYSDGVLTLGIPKGDTGATGNGISRVEFNEDYSLTFYFTDSEPFTTPSIRGAQGARGYGIASVEKIDSTGLVDTYRITFEDPSVQPTTFTVTNGEEGPQGPRGYTGETGNGIDRIELTDTTGAVKTYTIYFTDGSTYDFEVTDGEVTDAVLDEATIVQANSDNVPYLFRPSGGDVRTGRKEFDTIVGGTVAWNQLVSDANFNGSPYPSGSTISYDSNTDTLSYSGAISSNGYGYVMKSNSIIKDHAYLISFNINATNATGVWAKADPNGATPATHNYSNGQHSFIQKSTRTATASVILGVSASEGTTVTADFSKVNVVDLTAYFGSATIADYVYTLESGTAGAGVAWLRANAPQLFEYHAYDAGSLVSVSGLTSHNTVGFNQWDEEWEVGAYSNANGNKITASNRIRSKNYIPILPSTIYYGQYGGSGGLDAWFYDENKTFTGDVVNITRTTFTTPNNARYMNIATYNAGSETYNHDISINLSDASLNGTYEPYVKHSYPLDSSLTLRGIPKLDASNNLYYDGDVYGSDGTVTRRYAVVDLGTLSWSRNSTSGVFATSGLVGDAPVVTPPYDNRAKGAICAKYQPDTQFSINENMHDKTWLRGGYGTLYIQDLAYSDAASLKASLSGVYFVYLKATPTIETADPYTNPQIVDPSGTEEYVGSPIPVGHETDYPMTLTDTMPTADGNYTLNLTVANGKRSVSWT